MQRQTLELKEEVFGVDNPDTLSIMQQVATTLQVQGRYEEAEQMQRQTLEMREKFLGIDHPDTLDSMFSLGVVLQGQGKYVEAEQMLRQTLEHEWREEFVNIIRERLESTVANRSNNTV